MWHQEFNLNEKPNVELSVMRYALPYLDTLQKYILCLNEMLTIITFPHFSCQLDIRVFALHKKWSFPLRISSVNVTKSPGSVTIFGHISEEVVNGKLHFVCSVQ